MPSPLVVQCLPALLPFITMLVNLCFSSGQFPSKLKSAIVQPLLKKSSLDPEILKNFRPVSNLSFLSKIIERMIASQLLEHMIRHNLLDKFQSAYRPLHSTETALVRVLNDLLLAIDKGMCAFLVLLDLSAAFDTVNFATLLAFLKDFLGLSGSVLDTIRSYLEGRTQCVSIKNVLSHLSELIYGVPQGSVLGPLIFCLYTLPLGEILRHHNINYMIYADDTQVYCFFDVDTCDAALLSVTQCIKDIRSWMIRSKLKINDDKTEFLILSSQRSKYNPKQSLSIGKSVVQSSDSCRNLGVMFDRHLTLNSHISAVCRNTLFYLRKIGSIRSLLTDTAAAQLVHALVSSRLDYCNSLLYGMHDSQLKRLQRVQNVAARIVSRVDKQAHITPVLYSLHWLPIKFRIVFKILLLTYRCLNGTAPAYLTELIKPYIPTRSLRSASQHLLVIPKTKLCSYGNRSFAYAAAKEWNQLPDDVKNSPSVDSFKTKLKTHFFKRHFLD